MNASTKQELAVLGDRPYALSLPEDELIATLRGSLYAGVSDNMIKLVIGYCKAGNLDPMQKPVHVVPMNVKKAGTRDYEWRDVVMPGIGLYRTQAARTGEHVGTDEPEFGPLVELRIGDFVMQHPEWCKVTVYRMKNGVKCAFTAKEYWIENYATAGKDSLMPNAMWKKRWRGQLAKCAEAQALRKGFPEVGNQPTADEMEGKVIGDLDDGGNVTLNPDAPGRKPAVNMPQAKPAAAAAGVTDVTPKDGAQPTGGDNQAQEQREPNTTLASEGERKYILNKARSAGVEVAVLMETAGIVGLPADLAGLTKYGFIALKDALPK
jgi:phage recombination protein Bet